MPPGFATAEAHAVTFPNPLLDQDSASTVYVVHNVQAGQLIARRQSVGFE